MPAPLAVIWKPPSCVGAVGVGVAGAAQHSAEHRRGEHHRRRVARRRPTAGRCCWRRGSCVHPVGRRAESAAQVRVGEIVGQVVRCADGHDPALRHQADPGGHTERGLGELLGEEDRPRPRRRSGRRGRRARRRSSARAPSRSRRAAAAAGSRLSARAMASICCSPPDMVPASCWRRSASRGKRREGVLLDVAARGPGVGHHPQVLGDRQVREHAAALGDGAQPGAGQGVGRDAVDVAAEHVEAARGRRQLAAGHLRAWSTCRRRSGRAGPAPRRPARRGRRRAAPRCGRSRADAAASRGGRRRCAGRAAVAVGSAPARPSRPARLGVVGRPEVGGQHPGVGPDLAGVPTARIGAEVEDVDRRRPPSRAPRRARRAAPRCPSPARRAAGRQLSVSVSSGPTTARRAAGAAAAVASARASSTRRAWPVGSVSARSSARARQPTAASTLVGVGAGLAAVAAQRLRISAATSTFSRTVSEPKTSSRWKVRAMPSRARRCGRLPRRSTPSRTTRPAVSACRPVMTLNSVVLPAPFGPISPVTWPGLDVEVDPARATTPPKRTSALATSSRVPRLRAAPCRRIRPPLRGSSPARGAESCAGSVGERAGQEASCGRQFGKPRRPSSLVPMEQRSAERWTKLATARYEALHAGSPKAVNGTTRRTR